MLSISYVAQIDYSLRDIPISWAGSTINKYLFVSFIAKYILLKLQLKDTKTGLPTLKRIRGS